jgi:prepilin-type N-terminal cleavage/methylation domain-containing protein
MNKRGFTLIELTVAIGIVLILATITFVNYNRMISNKKLHMICNSAYNGLYLYYTTNEKLPSDVQSFVNGTSDDSKGLITKPPYSITASATGSVSDGYDVTLTVKGHSFQYQLPAIKVVP